MKHTTFSTQRSILWTLTLGVTLFCTLFFRASAQTMADNWWFGVRTDTVGGINVTGMTRFVQTHDLKPASHPLVAVIDGGFDFSNPWFRPLLKDTLGWNFLGNAQGDNFERAGTEAYREFKRLYPRFKGVAKPEDLPQSDRKDYAWYQQMAREIHIESYLVMAMNQEYTWQAVRTVDSLMHRCYGDRPDTRLKDLYEIDVEDTTGIMAPIEATLQWCVRYDKEKPWSDIVSEVKKDYEVSHKRILSLDTDDDVHRKIGNDPTDFQNLTYGNANYRQDAYHGTMVSALVTEMMRQAHLHTTLIPLRAIPDGDEYDRDVTAALRRAVDGGAKVINMSFGKYHSPQEAEVKKAIRYALDHDVLLVAAAGNFGKDNDQKPLYPRPYMEDDTTRWPHMLVVAASDTDGRLAKMSCRGTKSVDILAPGMSITSVQPQEGYDTQNGTSLSAPIVSGLALVIRSYFPDLTAPQVLECIKTSATQDLIDCEKALRRAYHESRYGDGLFHQAEAMNSDSIHRLVPNRSLHTDFLPGGRYVHYTRETPGDKVPTHYLFDSKTRQETTLFHDPRYKYLSDPHMTRDGRAFAFRAKGTPLEYNLKTRQITASQDTLPKDQPSFGPRGDHRRNYTTDSLYYITALGHDLWLYNTQSGDSTRLTHDGTYCNSYAMSGSGSTDNVKAGRRETPLGLWVGTTHRYLVIREDKRSVGTMTLVNSLTQGRPKAVTYRFAMPGDTAVSTFNAQLIDADRVEVTPLRLTDRKDDILDIPRFGRLVHSGQNVYLLSKSRYQDTITLWRINGQRGDATPIIREVTAPHLNEQLFSFHPFNEGNELLWWSERTGKGRYYLYDGDGHLKHAVTPEDMIAGPVVRIDTLARHIIVEGYGRENPAYNPAYRYYYRCSLSGGKPLCLTPKAGHHEIRFNPQHTLYTDQCSRMDMPPVYTLYNSKAQALGILSQSDLKATTAAGRNLPQIVKVTAADGMTPLWGLVYTPFWMQAGDRLPIVSNPYPGPHTDLIPLGYEPDDNGNQTLADLGFIVLNFSYRGSNPYRGRDFYTHGYQNLRDYALDDDRATIRQVAQMIPQADTLRVGIYGHSGGGFMTTAAILQHPELYKVAVAASGNHDNNIYTKWWGETFHGRGPIPTNMELAQNLQGRLLLIHGDMDNNVHPASTLRMAQSLIEAGKTFDMLILPGKDHGLGDNYYMNRIRYYLLEHLSGRQFDHINILEHE